jgi:hypothetical protein
MLQDLLPWRVCLPLADGPSLATFIRHGSHHPSNEGVELDLADLGGHSGFLLMRLTLAITWPQMVLHQAGSHAVAAQVNGSVRCLSRSPHCVQTLWKIVSIQFI